MQPKHKLSSTGNSPSSSTGDGPSSSTGDSPRCNLENGDNICLETWRTTKTITHKLQTGVCTE
uniref:Uncharacterized protein n=1 Tax=Arion vulgaris TaxID=1028688 RepID=A0A0B7BSX2_9EUPU